MKCVNLCALLLAALAVPGLIVATEGVRRHEQATEVSYLGVDTTAYVDRRNKQIALDNGWIDIYGDQFHGWRQVWNYHTIKMIDGKLKSTHSTGGGRHGPPVQAIQDASSGDRALWNRIFGST